MFAIFAFIVKLSAHKPQLDQELNEEKVHFYWEQALDTHFRRLRLQFSKCARKIRLGLV